MNSITYSFKEDPLLIVTQVASGNEFISLLNKIYISIFLFFGYMGILILLSKNDLKSSPSIVVALLGLIFLVLYVPSPIFMFSEITQNFRLDRVSLLLTIFMSFIMGYGIWYSITKSVSISKLIPIVILFSVLLYISLSISSVSNAGDSEYITSVSRPYFKLSELDALNFVKKNDVLNIYSDYHVGRYFDSQSLSNKITSRIFTSPDLSYIKNDWIFLRVSELKLRGLEFSYGGTTSKTYKYRLNDTDKDMYTISLNLAKKNKTYDNGNVWIFSS
ncbi:MAG: hypothetical protein O8C61_12385 [Candidatus Methanoperedens sp.]|nr:hypothetical protein [Candidatus Methanoperedens sp.]